MAASCARASGARRVADACGVTAISRLLRDGKCWAWCSALAPATLRSRASTANRTSSAHDTQPALASWPSSPYTWPLKSRSLSTAGASSDQAYRPAAAHEAAILTQVLAQPLSMLKELAEAEAVAQAVSSMAR
jgi:hypothetical protein